jgi:O-antigen ligase
MKAIMHLKQMFPRDVWFDIFLGVLVFGSVVTSIAYKTSVFNILLILSACFIWSKSIFKKNGTDVSLVVKIWSFSLVIYSLFWFFSLFNTVGSSSQDYEKPAKILFCAFIGYQLGKRQIRWAFLSYGMVLCIILAVMFALDHKYSRLEYGMNAGTAAYLLLIPVLFCLTNLIFNRGVGQLEWVFSFIAVIGGLWALTETQTRGALVVLICYFLAILPIKIASHIKNKKMEFHKGNTNGLAKPIAVAVAVAVAVAIPTSTELQEKYSNAMVKIEKRIKSTSKEISRIQGGNDFYGSIGARIALYHVGIEALKSPTLLGGGENSLANLTGYINSMENPERYEFLKRHLHFHNQFLDLYTKRGVLGFLSFLAYLFAPLLFANSLQRLYLLSAILPLAVGGMIETPFNSSNFVTFYPLYVTFILVAVRPRSVESKFNRPGTS